MLAQTRYRGVVAAFGLAQGADLPASVLPFILRNVTLTGNDSVNAPQEVRLQAWSRLARDLDLTKLARTLRKSRWRTCPVLLATFSLERCGGARWSTSTCDSHQEWSQ